MKATGIALSCVCAAILLVASPLCAAANDVMSEASWKLWNPEGQRKINRDIEQNRKADAVLKLRDVAPGVEVKAEQLSHDSDGFRLPQFAGVLQAVAFHP